MKKLLILLGMADEPAPKQTLTISFKSSYPQDRPSLQEWCQEFRVSMLHNRHATYFG